MKAKTIFPIVLAGGKGSRIWPLSRTFHPKQFLKFSSEISLFQQTILRLKSLRSENFFDPIVICHSVHFDLVKQQLDEVNGKDKSLLELGTNHGQTTHILAPLFKKANFTPNIITGINIFFCILCIYHLYFNNYNLAVIYLLLAYLFDCLDGFYARKYKMETEFGDLLDHYTDYIFYSCLYYFL